MVPHATGGHERRRSSSFQQHQKDPPNAKFKFPDYHEEEVFLEDDEVAQGGDSPRPLPNGLPTGMHSSERWPARRESALKSWTSGGMNRTGGTSRHGRQRSLSEAIKIVRTRRGASISENAQEIAESLKAPVSMRLVVCLSSPPAPGINSLSLMFSQSSSAASGMELRSSPTRPPKPS